MAEPQSSDAILNELFSKYNASFDAPDIQSTAKRRRSSSSSDDNSKSKASKRKKKKKVKEVKKTKPVKDKSESENPKSGTAGKKDSSAILNELFATYNASFDEPQSESSSSSNSDDESKPKKKRKKVRDKSESSLKDKEKRKKKGSKSKGKSKKDKSKKKEGSADAEGKDDKPFKPTTIVLDIEDGEILDEEEKALRKSAKKKKAEKDASPKKKVSKLKSVDSHAETDSAIKKSNRQTEYDKSNRRSGSPGRIDGERRRSSNTAPSSHGRHRHSSADNCSYRDRDRSSRSPVARRAPPREKEDDRDRDRDRGRDRYDHDASSSSRSSSYYKTNWQKASSRDTSYSSDRTYSHYNHDTRGRSYNYYESSRDNREHYGVGRSGFGYSGSSRVYYDEYDDYYDYKQNSSRYSSRRGRSRSRSRSRSRNPDDIIDKAKLLEIARKNAGKLMRKGCLPTDIFTRDEIVAIRAGGKNVEELTEYCQKLAEKDARGDLKDGGSSSEDEHFINHPFQVKDRPLPSIVMNIKNAIPLPVRSAHELALENAKLKVQFPVSSGTRHRYKELEWRPVEEDEKEKPSTGAGTECKSLVPMDGPKVGKVSPMPKEPVEGKTAANDNTGAGSSSTTLLAITDGSISVTENEKPKSFEDTKINTIPKVTVDISELISMRLRAMRRLEENPEDADAKEALVLASKEMKTWAESKALEPKFLTQAEITAGPQAWARKDQLINTTELKSGMGLHLLQKMGWKPGEGLGKNKEGATTPLALELKMDKKGLSSSADYPDKGPSLPNVFDLSAKHPVSALMELCMKRKWGAPTFNLCFEHGPSHNPQFVVKVTVNGVEYQPCIATTNKKLAKAQAAAFCLQSLGLLPTTLPMNKKGADAGNVSRNSRTASTTTPPPPAPKPNSTFLQTVPTPTSAPPAPTSWPGSTESTSSTTSDPEPIPVPPPPPLPPEDGAEQVPPIPEDNMPSVSQPQRLRPLLATPRPTRPRPLFARPLLPNPRFRPRHQHQHQMYTPRQMTRNTFTPRPRPPMYAPPMYRVPRDQIAPGPGPAFFDESGPYDPMYDESLQEFDEPPMQQMQMPNTGVYMQAAQNLAQATGQFFRPGAGGRPQQAQYPTYIDVPQIQVPLPEESGFPGLTTF